MPDNLTHIRGYVFGVGDTWSGPTERVSVVKGAEVRVLREGGEVGGRGGDVAVKRAGKEFRVDRKRLSDGGHEGLGEGQVVL